MPDLFIIIFATALSAFAFLAGGLISHRFSRFLARYSSQTIAFASGAMLAITFLHVLPESVDLGGEYTFLAVFAGVIFFYILENFLQIHTCPENSHKNTECENHTLGPLSAIGIGIHSFFDGLLIVFAFFANPTLGWFVALGIILHKLPAGAILHTLICHNHEKNSLWWVFGVALMTPLAAGVAPLLQNLPSSEPIGWGLAFSAGSLLYITLFGFIARDT